VGEELGQGRFNRLKNSIQQLCKGRASADDFVLEHVEDISRLQDSGLLTAMLNLISNKASRIQVEQMVAGNAKGGEQAMQQEEAPSSLGEALGAAIRRAEGGGEEREKKAGKGKSKKKHVGHFGIEMEEEAVPAMEQNKQTAATSRHEKLTGRKANDKASSSGQQEQSVSADDVVAAAEAFALKLL